MRKVILCGAVLLLAGCAFLRSQTSTSVAASCQRSCANVPADTQGECIARCQK